MDYLSSLMKLAEGEYFEAYCIRNRFYIDKWFRLMSKEIENFCDQRDVNVDGYDCAVFLWSCICAKYNTTLNTLFIKGKYVRWDDGWLVPDDKLVDMYYEDVPDWAEFFEEQFEKTPVQQKIGHVDLKVCILDDYNPDLTMNLTDVEFDIFRGNAYIDEPYLKFILMEPKDGVEVLIQEIVQLTPQFGGYDKLREIDLMILRELK